MVEGIGAYGAGLAERLLEAGMTVVEPSAMAARIRALDVELRDNRKALAELVETTAPKLTVAPGVGAVVAASVLIAWSHPGRLRSEAAFAALAGTCPIPASSGNTVRHRLNRGGDRRLNRALTTVVIVRMRIDPATRAYIARRGAEGRTTKEIMRSLKRYITRQLFRILTAAHQYLTDIEASRDRKDAKLRIPPHRRYVETLLAGCAQELATCRKFAPTARNYTASRLMADTGLRVNETRHLDLADIRWELGYFGKLHVRMGRGRGGRGRASGWCHCSTVPTG